MKKYKVRITREFTDKVEKVFREKGKVTEVFLCDEERYEYLLSKNAVRLVEVIEEKEEKKEIREEAEKQIEEVFEEVIEEIVEKPKKSKKKKIDNK